MSELEKVACELYSNKFIRGFTIEIAARKLAENSSGYLQNVFWELEKRAIHNQDLIRAYKARIIMLQAEIDELTNKSTTYL
jgi:hypothetical protein